jgi:L-alanine-DL-glutamate epimerase-like enolase superfamily enzyme
MIVSNPLRIEGGMAMPQDAAGSGVEWNEEGITRCTV